MALQGAATYTSEATRRTAVTLTAAHRWKCTITW